MLTLGRLDGFSSQRIQALLGLKPAALSALLSKALPALVGRREQVKAMRPGRKRAPGGGRKRKLQPYQEVLLTLIYLRHNVSHEIVGALFGVSADTSENTFHEVVLILREVCPSEAWDAEKRWKKGDPTWQPDELDKVLVDSFETPIARPSDAQRQRRTYSGKKKRHTLKTQVVTDAKGRILEIDPGHRGPQPDIKLYEQSGLKHRYRRAKKQGDKAYCSQDHPELQTPHKKPKGGQLTPQQRQENRQQAQTRI